MICISVVFLDDDGDEIDDVDEDVERFCDFVNRKDLLVFSAAIRNFSEITGTTTPFMKNTKATLSELYLSSGWPYHRDACIDGKPSRPALIDLIKQPVVFFTQRMLISFPTNLSTFLSLSMSTKRYFTLISKYSSKGDKRTEPMILIDTKQDRRTYLLLSRLVRMSKLYMKQVIDKLEKDGIYISKYLRDP